MGSFIPPSSRLGCLLLLGALGLLPVAGCRQETASGVTVVKVPALRMEQGKDTLGDWIRIDVGRRPVAAKFRLVKAGEFSMGGAQIPPTRPQDAPAHRVILTRDYWLATAECTQLLWLEVMGQNPSTHKDERPAKRAEALMRPVEMVSWNDTQKFFERLNQLAANSGQRIRFRLPTEAEWEYACRAGSTEKYGLPAQVRDLATGEMRKGQLGDCARYSANSDIIVNGVKKQKSTWSINERHPNPWGFYGMHGNVAEWCLDACEADPFNGISHPAYTEGAKDPLCSEGRCRVFRGGAWDSTASQCQSAWREGIFPDYRNNNIGFRMVLEIVVPKETPAVPAAH